MARRRGIKLEAGQEWTIGKRTHDLFENSMHKAYARLNLPLIDMGYECVITKIDGTSITVTEKESGRSLIITTHNLGKLIKR